MNLCYNLSEVQALQKKKNDKIQEKKRIIAYFQKNKTYKDKTLDDINLELD